MQHKMSYELFSKRGKRNEELGKDNEDSINVVTNGQYVFAILSDGAGSSKYAKEAADTTVEAASRYCFENSAKAFVDIKFFAEKLIFEIQYRLDQRARLLKTKFSEMICTLVLLGIDTKSKSYFTIHIGDGIIAKQDKDNWKIISFPENGRHKNTTFFCNSPTVFKHTRIKEKSYDSDESFFLASDGCFVGKYLSCEYLESIEKKLFQVMDDDISYCYINF